MVNAATDFGFEGPAGYSAKECDSTRVMTIDDEIICEMIRHKEAAIAWFGQSGKQERERFILRAFLRCLELSFNLLEIKSLNGEFPDVEFQGAEFEIKEMLDPDRRRHDEYKQGLEKLKKIKNISDLIEPYRPVFVTFHEVGQRIQPVLEDLCRKYPENQRVSTNLLIYCNLQDVMVDTKKEWVPITLDSMGWRSVSVVGSSWCYVFDSSTEAPQFITENVGRFRRKTGLWD